MQAGRASVRLLGGLIVALLSCNMLSQNPSSRSFSIYLSLQTRRRSNALLRRWCALTNDTFFTNVALPRYLASHCFSFADTLDFFQNICDRSLGTLFVLCTTILIPGRAEVGAIGGVRPSTDASRRRRGSRERCWRINYRPHRADQP